MSSTSVETSVTPPYPRVLGWFGTSAGRLGPSRNGNVLGLTGP